MDVLSYIKPKSNKVGTTEYENGRIYAFKSMVNIYMTFGRYYDQTRQAIYFFTYLKKMSDTCRMIGNEFSKGQTDAYDETFNHFRPSIREKD